MSFNTYAPRRESSSSRLSTEALLRLSAERKERDLFALCAKEESGEGLAGTTAQW